MAMRKTKPTSPGRRFAMYQLREEITSATPHKPLTKGKKSTGGRNAYGRVTARHRGGGAKRKYRVIDFKRRKDGVPAKVATIEYDPNRTTYIALLHYADGAKSYILAPNGLTVGSTVMSGEDADIRPGNALPLRAIPTGTVVHNVELTPGQGGRLGRAAGTSIQVVAKEGDMVTLRLPSSEMRMVRAECRATVGTLSNAEHQNVKIGKAGRNRHKAAPADPRGRDEPGRPSARRRRGTPHAGWPSGHAVGQAHPRVQDPEEGQALGRADRARPPARQEEALTTTTKT